MRVPDNASEQSTAALERGAVICSLPKQSVAFEERANPPLPHSEAEAREPTIENNTRRSLGGNA